MYDPETASLLRSAPELPDLNPNDLPRLLTGHYAQIVSMRLGGEEEVDESSEWTLDRIADTYELIVSVHSDPLIRRPSAFVAASAQQIIGRREELINAGNDALENISRDSLSPEISAVLLFLSAEQYADAHEAASKITINKDGQSTLVSIITRHVVDLAKGRLTNIINRGIERIGADSSQVDYSIESVAVFAMLHTLASGIEGLAYFVLGTTNPHDQATSPRALFERVQSLSVSSRQGEVISRMDVSYPGIHHLASLLIAAYDGIAESALSKLAVPVGSDSDFWKRWLSFRAGKFPYIWPNHRKALDEGFHHNGISAVMVLPTGAGKTTVSSIKIASVLSQGRKVIFLAPTHALVEQLTSDLQEMFPKNILGSSVSSDFDLLFQIGAVLPEIEVMTPERCLAMLSFSPDSFDEVGLLVFDECHLLSPASGKIRRSLDSMLCLLAFNKIAPDADTLFLSAMVENGQEFASWISGLTSRNCISIDLLWKPSRQARGVVIFKQDGIAGIRAQASFVQRRLDNEANQPAVDIRAAASRELKIQPHAIWGLQHNWLDMANNKAVCTFTKLIDDEVILSGGISDVGLFIKPNVNAVASKIAIISAVNKLKTIIFVNQKSHAISTAKSISNGLAINVEPTVEENLKWEALEQELGDLKHSLLTKGAAAVPHNASMLRIERDLSEQVFKRIDGAMVIVATPTLAQGLNLPAQLAILAGDKRADVENGGRESLEAHELLNAAARAGRAGHLANGIVLLVPEPVLTFPENHGLNDGVVQKLQSLIPEDDRCVEITDPLGVILDRISAGDILDRDVSYMVNRLATLNDAENEENTLFNLNRSFAAFRANEQSEEQHFKEQLNELSRLVEQEAVDQIDQSLSILASQSGLPPLVLSRLKTSIEADLGSLPVTVVDWIMWLVAWLQADIDARDILLYDVRSSVLAATGRRKGGPFTNEALIDITPGIISWISGKPICEIEIALGGNPESNNVTAKVCPRSRELISSVLPRGLSFLMGLITRVVSDIDPYEDQEGLTAELIDSLSPAVRLGYDTPEKLAFSLRHPEILSRVCMHQEFVNQS